MKDFLEIFKNDPTKNKSSVLSVHEEVRLFSRVHATLQPTLSVGWSVSWSVGHTLFSLSLLFLKSLLVILSNFKTF